MKYPLGLCCLLLPLLHLRAQTERDSTPVFFLSLDGYYRYASTNAPLPTSPILDHDQMSIGWVSAGVEHQWGPAGVSAKLAFGPRAQQFYDEGNDNIFSNVREAFAFLDVTERIRVRAGLFPAFYGYEADDPFDNDIYSNSWAYTLAPACPAGVELYVSAGSYWRFMLGRYNEVFSRFNPNQTSIYGGVAAYDRGQWSAQLSTLLGTTTTDRRITALDLVVAYEPNDKWKIGSELVYHPFRDPGTEATHYASAGLYLHRRITAELALALRLEWLDDTGGFNFAPSTGVAATTLAAHRTWNRMKLFAEVRFDWANRAVFGAEDDDRELGGLLGFGYLL